MNSWEKRDRPAVSLVVSLLTIGLCLVTIATFASCGGFRCQCESRWNRRHLIVSGYDPADAVSWCTRLCATTLQAVP
jgi:hypothetical protein